MRIEERAWRPVVRSQRGVVSSGHYLASMAGARVLQQGGNAIDAGVAAGLVLNVVHGDMCTLSGVAPIIAYDARRQRVRSYAGIGTWPSKGRPQEITWADGELPVPHRWIVPAALDAWLAVLTDSGTMSFGDVADDAATLAHDGYPMYEFQYYNLEVKDEELRRWPENLAVFRDTEVVRLPGSMVVQRDLARTLAALVEVESETAGRREAKLQAVRDWFYRGPIARQMAEYAQKYGSWLKVDDFAAYAVAVELPPSIEYGDLQVYACGPWSQGMVLLQALTILEGTGVRQLECNSPPYIHLVTEALNLAFADREGFYGDPDFTDVPMERLLSKDYAAARRSLIREDQAFGRMPPPGEGGFGGLEHPERRWTKDVPRDTSYVAVIDAEGNMFSATPSDALVSSPIVPGLGLPISPRGVQFSGLAGSPNSVAPGKRPRLTPSPAMVLRAGKPFMAIGTPGLDRQPQAILQVLLNMLEFGRNPQQAVELPRFASASFPSAQQPHPYYPGRLYLEAALMARNSQSLTSLGHDVAEWPDRRWQAGGVCVVVRDLATGMLSGGADPRRESYAIAV